ncbi:ThiF family adenylyltransferase [Roseimaritima ulvae]|uniref:Molybdopterin-synthase adenylyltransferase n=1 Tax=Roseimaritima ulvae TaxID=980254 RepID=A0A5B9QVS3_9BACT|nr:ThiF family adenylyltransferase [Roseimaritima ulvae]QEG41196.1 Molybdopterin-synthase adenylyltransferase [Roseimaritima ulvae]
MSTSHRYERQSRFAPIGEAGQRRLADAHVAILGCGALGSVAAEILARAGVGTLTLIDRDTVEWSNLQRQSLYIEDDAVAGRAKADAACQRLQQINSTIQIIPQVVDVTAENIAELLSPVDLALDGTDNFGTRFLLNDYSLERSLPWVHGGCVGATGQVAMFSGLGQPCFRCLVPSPPDPASVQTCDTAGVVGAATHTIASLEAMQAIRYLTAATAPPIAAEVLSLDLWQQRVRTIKIPPVRCAACSLGHRDFLHGQMAAAADRSAVLCGRNAVQVHAPEQAASTRLDLAAVAARWQDIGSVDENAFFVRLHLEDEQSLTLFRDGRAVIGGTEDLALARSLYARYVGG